MLQDLEGKSFLSSRHWTIRIEDLVFLDLHGVSQLEGTRGEAKRKDDEGALRCLLLDGIRQRPAPLLLALSLQGISRSISLSWFAFFMLVQTGLLSLLKKSNLTNSLPTREIAAHLQTQYTSKRTKGSQIIGLKEACPQQ